MVRLLSSKNRNVSKIWFVVLAFFIAVVIIGRDTARTIRELEAAIFTAVAEPH